MLRYKTVAYEVEIPQSLQSFKTWEFSSGGITGEDFKVFARKFRSYIKKNLPAEAELINNSIGHYIISGFIKKGNKYVYFSISDVRHFPNSWVDNILIRTATSEKDYTGGSNDYTTLKKFTSDVERLLTF